MEPYRLVLRGGLLGEKLLQVCVVVPQDSCIYVYVYMCVSKQMLPLEVNKLVTLFALMSKRLEAMLL